MEKKYKVISLFSGCGGLDLGFLGNFEIFGKHFESNNFDVIWANDIYKQAAETYRHNIGNHIVIGDITEIKDEEIPKDADIVLGGFPCQDFSVAGKRQGITVQRGQLYLQLKRVIDHVKPKVFVAENVEGLVNLENGLILQTIKNDFEESGYKVSHHLLNAADYGVPQTRKRVFIVGVREELDVEFYPPVPTHEGRWMTSQEAIGDLWGREDDETLFNHNQRSNAKFYPGRRMQGNNRIKKDEPSCTIRAEHHGNIEAHYQSSNSENPEDMSGWRRLTVRECARIQTFPDNFELLGPGTHTYKMVGNAVPPVLGWNIAQAVYHVLERVEMRKIKECV
ncbi:DNA cytosine methyltransferase [Bacillus cereus group sp. MYBK71-2]|uniref:DNA cytosine methyltransferase n=1 Tax=unclassified Bacillus cereus group TaxID=2750818 RepID=UPI0022E8D400|nr:DNA cytosine methyltransferase [Bacillus cereus group sp. Bc010]MDA2771321.1 DNA cytosine methyltransferase [Bacillus cereus group sp. Bc010]